MKKENEDVVAFNLENIDIAFEKNEKGL